MRNTASGWIRGLGGVAAVAGLLALGCTLNPVVTAPRVESTPYDDCERAALDYCELVVDAGEADLEGCVANYTYQCVSGLSE